MAIRYASVGEFRSDPADLKSAAVKHPGSNPGRGTIKNGIRISLLFKFKIYLFIKEINI